MVSFNFARSIVLASSVIFAATSTFPVSGRQTYGVGLNIKDNGLRHQHLYVGTRNRGGTQVYDLINGIPAQVPSRYIPYGASETVAETVGPDGTVHVVRWEGSNGIYYEDEYLAQSGSHYREMALDLRGDETIFVDHENYTYFSGYSPELLGGAVEVFSPPPHRHKVQEFTIPYYYGAWGLAVDGSTLFVVGNDNKVHVYTDVRSNPRYGGFFCTSHHEFIVAASGGFVFVASGDSQPFTHGYAAFSEHQRSCPATPERVIAPASPIEFNTFEAGAFESMLYAIMLPNLGLTPELFVFDVHRGRQEPLASIFSRDGFGGYAAVGP